MINKDFKDQPGGDGMGEQMEEASEDAEEIGETVKEEGTDQTTTPMDARDAASLTAHRTSAQPVARCVTIAGNSDTSVESAEPTHNSDGAYLPQERR